MASSVCACAWCVCMSDCVSATCLGQCKFGSMSTSGVVVCVQCCRCLSVCRCRRCIGRTEAAATCFPTMCTPPPCHPCPRYRPLKFRPLSTHCRRASLNKRWDKCCKIINGHVIAAAIPTSFASRWACCRRPAPWVHAWPPAAPPRCRARYSVCGIHFHPQGRRATQVAAVFAASVKRAHLALIHSLKPLDITMLAALRAQSLRATRAAGAVRMLVGGGRYLAARDDAAGMPPPEIPPTPTTTTTLTPHSPLHSVPPLRAACRPTLTRRTPRALSPSH